VTHPYVGDLRLRLTHVDPGTTVSLLQSSVPPDACNTDDINAVFDDEAGRIAQTECPASPPALDGSVKPLEPLSGFDGQSIAGTWRLNVADLNELDEGSLLDWCLIVNSRAPVVTGFTCDGDEECIVEVNNIFGLSFDFFDPDGNASRWRITAERDDDVTFNVANGFISLPSGSGTVSVNINPFTCEGGACRETEYDYRVIITDLTGLESPPQRVHIIVPEVGP
jgi:hypothetical protein